MWALTLLSLPFNRFTIVGQPTFFEQGKLNLYLSQMIYGTEILILLTFLLWQIVTIIQKEEARWNPKIIQGGWLLGGLMTVSILFSEDRINSMFYAFHFLNGFLLVLLIQGELLKKETVEKIFIGSVGVQILIGGIQVITQKSIGLKLLGESLVSPETLGVAKINLFGETFIRAYGTFPHANILAGYALIALVLLILKKNKKNFDKIGIGIMLLGLFITYSEAALGAAGLIFALKQEKPKKWFLAGGMGMLIYLGLQGKDFLQSESLQERLTYIKISLMMLFKHPQGVGLGEFTAHMQQMTGMKLQPWQFQPVHNIFLLFLNEWGVISGIILGKAVGDRCASLFALDRSRTKPGEDWAARKGAHHRGPRSGLSIAKEEWGDRRSGPTGLPILALGVIGLFDHYLLSLYPGIVLTAITLGLNFNPGVHLKNEGAHVKNY